MQFINVSYTPVYTSFSGTLNPGQISADGGRARRRLEEALSEVVKICGDRLGIRLNTREAELLKKLIELDERGDRFNKSDLPLEVQNDPTGEKRNEEERVMAQQREAEEKDRIFEERRKREAIINGETQQKSPGQTVGVGNDVKKSGFDAIMRENARIEAAKKETVKNVEMLLDPIHANAKKTDDSVSPEFAQKASQQNNEPEPSAPVEGKHKRGRKAKQ